MCPRCLRLRELCRICPAQAEVEPWEALLDEVRKILGRRDRLGGCDIDFLQDAHQRRAPRRGLLVEVVSQGDAAAASYHSLARLARAACLRVISSGYVATYR